MGAKTFLSGLTFRGKPWVNLPRPPLLALWGPKEGFWGPFGPKTSGGGQLGKKAFFFLAPRATVPGFGGPQPGGRPNLGRVGPFGGGENPLDNPGVVIFPPGALGFGLGFWAAGVGGLGGLPFLGFRFPPISPLFLGSSGVFPLPLGGALVWGVPPFGIISWGPGGLYTFRGGPGGPLSRGPYLIFLPLGPRGFWGPSGAFPPLFWRPPPVDPGTILRRGVSGAQTL